jgi:hypothetical protein
MWLNSLSFLESAMYLTEFAQMPLWMLGSLIVVAGGLLATGAALVHALLAGRTRIADDGLPQALPWRPELDYEVIAVPPELAGEYQRLQPLSPSFQAFAEAVLGNPDYVRHHAAVRADARRYAAMYAGKALFVQVRRMG